jgi:two-component system, chemotaxis family, CheB/CheR fusion protein
MQRGGGGLQFAHAVSRTDRGPKCQTALFASDVDAEAVASARDGVYSESIKADISPERLARFFAREGEAYRVLPELRASIVFSVQDMLADPPLSG